MPHVHSLTLGGILTVQFSFKEGQKALHTQFPLGGQSPLRVQKQKWASHFRNLGVWRPNPESQKTAIGGPFY
jgi:hypothetical protein